MDTGQPIDLPAKAGRFRLEEKLEGEGSEDVFAAVDTDGGAQVVVHVLRGEGGTARRERLLREAKRAGQVKHEGLAVVLDVGTTETGEVFVAVEKLEGERLSDRLRGGASLPEREATSIAAQIARALGVAHDAGVVHRDLRPAVVVLSGEGEATRVKVGGLATPRSAPAAEDALAAAFAAPEQRRGEAAGRRADVYSIGAMLHTMLTGGPPGSGAERVVAGPLGDIVKRCLAEDPRERFLDTIALGAALRTALDTPPAPRARSSPSVRPPPVEAAAAGAASERPPPASHRVASRPISVRPPSVDAPVAAPRPPAAPPPRPLGRPLTARPRWEEALLDLREGPLPRVAITAIVAFVIARILTSGVVPFVVAVAAAVASYATKYWRGSRG